MMLLLRAWFWTLIAFIVVLVIAQAVDLWVKARQRRAAERAWAALMADLDRDPGDPEERARRSGL